MMRKQVELFKVSCKHYNNAYRRSKLHIWASRPSSPSTTTSSFTSHSSSSLETDAPSILLFGFAGSSPHHLDKQAGVYSSLGYSTLATILPAQYTFSYDIRQITTCAHLVLEAVYKHRCKEVVIHSLSNNGAILYQHLSQLVVEEYRDIKIKGAVFDSAPGPGTHIENLQSFGILPKYLPGFTRGKLSKQWFYVSYPFINRINGMGLKEMWTASVNQARSLEVNWKLHNTTPWPGPYLMNERADWPLLFLYSKKDNQIPWRYITSVADKQREQGRKVNTHMFRNSGHVAHLKIHPEQYRHALETFMKELS